MIIRFTVSNFRSYKKETVLDFVSSSKITKPADHERRFDRLSVVKNIGIFGSNAFGKSNILNALASMVNLVVNGNCSENMSFIDTPNVPTNFDMVFLTDDSKFYEYSFSIKKENIITPWVVMDEALHQLYLNGKSELIYSKHEGLVGIDNDALVIFQNAYKNVNDQLFLKYINAKERFIKDSKLSNLLRKIYNFFLLNLAFNLDNGPMLFLINKDNVAKITSYLRRYDVGMENAQFQAASSDEISKITSDPIFEFIRNEFRNKSNIKEQYFSDGKNIYVVSLQNGTYGIQKLIFKHKGVENTFCYGYESNGTQRLFTLLALLFDKKNANRTIIIDEIERSAFSGIASQLIKDFQEEFKETNAQLVFTSHLNSLMREVLRRDEVYFVDKNSFGESILYPLSSFKPLTRENVSKEFLGGSYGAVPRIGVKI